MPILNDPDNPYLEPGPSYVAPPPPPPPPPVAPAQPGGTTGDDFTSSVAQTISEQYTAPPAQAPFQGDPDYVPESPGPSYSGPGLGSGDITPNLGVNYYDLPGNVNTGVGVEYVDSQAPGYVDPFAPDALQSTYQSYLSQNMPALPTLGDGSGWFGTPDQQKQQYGWWQAEVTKAIQSGDMDYYNQLMTELSGVREQYNAYYGYDVGPQGASIAGQQHIAGALDGWNQTYNDLTAQFMRQLNGASQFDPLGEGGYVRNDIQLPSENRAEGGVTAPQYISRLALEGAANQINLNDATMRNQAEISRLYGQAMAGPSQQDITQQNIESILGLMQDPHLTDQQRQGMVDYLRFGPTTIERGGRSFGQSPLGELQGQLTEGLPDYMQSAYMAGSLPTQSDSLLTRAVGTGLGALNTGREAVAGLNVKGLSVGDALGATGNAGLYALSEPGNMVKNQLSYDAITLKNTFIDPTSFFHTQLNQSKEEHQQQKQEAQFLIKRFEDYNPVGAFVVEAAADPWNIVPFHAAVPAFKGWKAARFIDDVAEVMPPGEVDGYKEFARKATIWDNRQIKTGAENLAAELPKNNILSEAVAKRLSIDTKMGVARGETPSTVMADVFGDLDNIIQRLGDKVTPEAITEFRAAVGKKGAQQRILEALTANAQIKAIPANVPTVIALGPGETQVADRGSQLDVAADAIPERPAYEPKPAPVAPPTPAVAGTFVAPSQGQVNWLQDLHRQGYLSNAEIKRLNTGGMDKIEAAHLIEQRAAARDMIANPTQQATAGYPVDPLSAAGETPESIAAVREQAWRQSVQANINDMLPRAYTSELGKNFPRGYVRDNAYLGEGVSTTKRPRVTTFISGNETPVMSPADIRSVVSNLLDDDAITNTRLKHALEEIRDLGTYVKADGTISSDTVSTEFKRAVDDLRQIVLDPSVEKSDVAALHDAFLHHYTGDSDAAARDARRAQAHWAALDQPAKDAKTAELNDLKQKNIDLAQARNEAVKRDPKSVEARNLRAQLDRQTATIQAWEPDYKVRVPRKPPLAAVQEKLVPVVAEVQAPLDALKQQAQQLKAELDAYQSGMTALDEQSAARFSQLEQSDAALTEQIKQAQETVDLLPQPSDPAAGFHPDPAQSAQDATADILAKIRPFSGNPYEAFSFVEPDVRRTSAVFSRMVDDLGTMKGFADGMAIPGPIPPDVRAAAERLGIVVQHDDAPILQLYWEEQGPKIEMANLDPKASPIGPSQGRGFQRVTDPQAISDRIGNIMSQPGYSTNQRLKDQVVALDDQLREIEANPALAYDYQSPGNARKPVQQPLVDITVKPMYRGQYGEQVQAGEYGAAFFTDDKSIAQRYAQSAGEQGRVVTADMPSNILDLSDPNNLQRFSEGVAAKTGESPEAIAARVKGSGTVRITPEMRAWGEENGFAGFRTGTDSGLNYNTVALFKPEAASVRRVEQSTTATQYMAARSFAADPKNAKIVAAIQRGPVAPNMAGPVKRALEQAGTTSEAVWKIGQKTGDIAADGGGLGFLGRGYLYGPPGSPLDAFAGLPDDVRQMIDYARYSGSEAAFALKAKYVDHIDPALANWGKFDWSDPKMAEAYDNWAKAHYSHGEWFGKGDKGLFALAKGSQVTKFGDQIEMSFASIADEIYAHPELYPDPRQALADYADTLMTGSHAQLLGVKGHYYVYSKEGQAELKNFRQFYSQEIKDKLLRGDYDQRQGIGRLWGDIMGTTNDGKIGWKQIAAFDKKVMTGGRSKSRAIREMSDALKPTWVEKVRSNPEFFDAAKNAWLPTQANGARLDSITMDALDTLLFGSQDVNVMGMAHEMASDLSLKMAEHLGYNPDNVSPELRLMAAIKGNMAPLWMTMNPGYHVRNIAGNVTSTLIGMGRADMHGGFGMNERFARAIADEGSGVQMMPWVTEGVTKSNEAASNSKRLVPKLIKKTPGLNQLEQAGRATSDIMESTAKVGNYTHEWAHTYTTTWQKRVESLDIPNELKQELLPAVGMNQTLAALDGQPANVRKLVMAYQREAVATANVKAYDTTAKVLRDYRMRSRADTILDRVFPIHYWTTRNMLFVGSTMANRPAATLHAFAAMAAWEQANQSLPPSMRTGYLHLPSEVTKPLGLGDNYYINVKSFLNPAFFAIPKLLQTAALDLSDGSLPHRLDAFAKDGPKALYESMGYNIGPQYDIAIKAGNAASQVIGQDNAFGKALDAVLRPGNYLVSPRGYMPGVIPYQSVITSIKGPNVSIGGKRYNIGPETAQEWLYKQVYGTPYMVSESRKFNLRAATALQNGDITQGQFIVISDALSKNQFDYDPNYAKDAYQQRGASFGMTQADVDAALKMVRPIIDATLDQEATGWLKGGFLPFSGRNLTQSSIAEQKANTRYQQIKQWAAQDVDVLKQGLVSDAEYRTMIDKHGQLSANTWLRNNVPWLPSFWGASDSPDQIAQSNALDAVYSLEQIRYGEAQQAYQQKAAGQALTNPYYARIDRLGQARDNAIARANDNAVLVDKAIKVFNQGQAEVYADAQAAGVPMANPDLIKTLPTYGQDYNLTPAQRLLAEKNDALGAVNEHALDQQQRAALLDMVDDKLGVSLYLPAETPGAAVNSTVLNPEFMLLGDDGKPVLTSDGKPIVDWKAYTKAVQEVAPQAAAAYHELVMSYVQGGHDVRIGAIAQSITADDFIFHNRDKNAAAHAYNEEKQSAKDAYYDMPAGDEKNATRQAIIDKYGADVFDKTYYDGAGFTADQNRVYNEGGQQLSDIYNNNMTPTDKQAFKKRHPEAFSKATGTDDDGSTYTYDAFDWKKLSSDSISSELTQLGFNPDGSISGKEGIGSPDMGAGYGGTAEVAHIEDLSKQFHALVPDGLTKEDVDQRQAAYNAVYDVIGGQLMYDADGKPMLGEDGQQLTLAEYAENVKNTYKNRKGESTWTKALYSVPDGPVKEFISQLVTAQEPMFPIWDAQKAWFNAQSPADQQLLIAEGGNSFVNYSAGVDTASAAGPTTDTPATVGTSSGTSLPTSSGGTGYSSGPTAVSAGNRSVSAGTGSSGSGTTTASPTAYTKQLASLDPWFIAGNKDDGRGAVINQVSAYLANRLFMFQFIPDGNKYTQYILMGFMANIQKKLGPNPTISDWQAILDDLLNPQSGQAGPDKRPAAFEPQQIVPQSFQAPAGVGY